MNLFHNRYGPKSPAAFVAGLLEIRFVLHTISFDALNFKFMLLQWLSTWTDSHISV